LLLSGLHILAIIVQRLEVGPTCDASTVMLSTNGANKCFEQYRSQLLTL
jgi:hypothetical protein